MHYIHAVVFPGVFVHRNANTIPGFRNICGFVLKLHRIDLLHEVRSVALDMDHVADMQLAFRYFHRCYMQMSEVVGYGTDLGLANVMSPLNYRVLPKV